MATRLTIQEICVLDTVCGTFGEFRQFVRQVTLANVSHEDNLDAIFSFARDMNVSADELLTYLRFKAQLAEQRIASLEGGLEEMAKEFGVPLDELEHYAQTYSGEPSPEALEEFMEEERGAMGLA